MRVGRGAQEIATQADEHFELARVHGLNRPHGIEPVPLRRGKVELLAERGQKLWAHLFPDTHGAIALHVAVTAHRTEPRSAPADLPAQERKVYDTLHVLHAVLVLRDAHRPAAD